MDKHFSQGHKSGAHARLHACSHTCTLAHSNASAYACARMPLKTSVLLQARARPCASAPIGWLAPMAFIPQRSWPAPIPEEEELAGPDGWSVAGSAAPTTSSSGLPLPLPAGFQLPPPAPQGSASSSVVDLWIYRTKSYFCRLTFLDCGWVVPGQIGGICSPICCNLHAYISYVCVYIYICVCVCVCA